jgi:hypothetical protein
MVGIDEKNLVQSASWNHLRDVLSGVIAEKPKNAVAVFEGRSVQAVTGHPVPAAAPTIYQDTQPKGRDLVNVAASVADVEWAARYVDQVAPQKKKKPAPADGEEPEEDFDEEDEEPEDKGELPDVAYEQSLFRQFGHGLSADETQRVVVAMKRLLDREPLQSARFWGKLFGAARDYYVAECKIDEGRLPEEPEDEDNLDEEEDDGSKKPETIQQGLNTYKAKAAPKAPLEPQGKVGSTNESVYYVATSDDLTLWVRLPDIRPAQIVAARSVHKLFTGDLDAAVYSHPPFPGVERHLLRAQIARIAHACTVAPKDIYGTEGAVPEEEEPEEGQPRPVRRFEVPAYEELPPLNPTVAPDAEDAEAIAPVKVWFGGYGEDELLDPKFWVHTAATLLQSGRTTAFNAADLEGEEEEPVDEDEPEDENPPAAPVEFVNPFLSDLGHDASLPDLGRGAKPLAAWAARKAPSTASDATRRYMIKSLVWPGAACVAEVEDGEPGALVFQNVYVGRGVKAVFGGVAAVAPPLPPAPCVEFPAAHLRLQRDATRDDEREFDPAPPVPTAEVDEEEEE